jgi:hypothetical protein
MNRDGAYDRCYPKSGHCAALTVCPLWAKADIVSLTRESVLEGNRPFSMRAVMARASD